MAPVANPRQGSLLEAVWALGSVKHLLEAGVDSLTFGEVAGRHSPLFFVLREVWGGGPVQVIPSASDDAGRVDGLVLSDGARRKVLLTNLTPEAQKVRVAWGPAPARLRLLNERATLDEQAPAGGDGFIALSLPAYAVAIIESEGGET